MKVAEIEFCGSVYHFPHYWLGDVVLELYQNPRFKDFTVHEFVPIERGNGRVYVEMNKGDFWRSVMVGLQSIHF